MPAGGVSVYRAFNNDRRYVALCALPLLFGIQQSFEGGVWLAGESGSTEWVQRFSLGYMFFSWLAWPVWVPFSICFIEPPSRHMLYHTFALLGGMLGAIQYFPYFLHTEWLTTEFLGYAISYNSQELFGILIGRDATYTIYLLVVIIPLLLSSDRNARTFGMLVMMVLAVTYFFFAFAYISVFCAGAAIMSLYLLGINFGKSKPIVQYR